MNAHASAESPVTEAAESAATKVLLVDRNNDVCSDMSNLVNAQEGFTVCAVANEAGAGLAAFRQLKPELVITGIAMPGIDGLKMTQMMLAEQPATKVLIHSVREDVPYGLKALRAGAKGYVRKGGRPSVLVNAMRHIAAEGLYLSPKIKEKLVSNAIFEDERKTGSPLQWLNDKEQSVFWWLGQGLGTLEIARKMNVSAGAVEGYRARIKDKLGLPDAHALVRCALQWEAQSKDSRAMRQGAEVLWRRE
jgi:DNA-binding NarL/FixJ family response regulator